MKCRMLPIPQDMPSSICSGPVESEIQLSGISWAPPALKFMHATELTDEEFKRFCGLIYRVAGIRIADTKRVLVANRVRRRLRATGIKSFSEYYTFLTSPAGSGEMPQFLDAITTNETYFYRDNQHYAWLGETFLPEIAQEGAQHKRPRSLRIWSAACSTGEEPYSIALRIMAKRH